MSYKQPLGVADNKSYKNTYHFNDNYYGKMSLEDAPSVNVDSPINSTIKENPYLSNVEIEGGELVLNPDLMALFKAIGKKHSRGGMDVNLKANSFVFSDDKSLAFTDSDIKKFEFKEGGTNTPADVVKKNVNVKHYNKMVANIQDLKKDDLAKKSSALMLGKYIEVLGNAAYLQEKKKQFPDGIPDFSMGTAPVYDAELKEDIMTEKQYSKYGGPIMQQGGYPTWLKAWRKANTQKGLISPTGKTTTYERTDQQLKEDYDYWKGVSGKDFKNPSDYQSFIYDYNLKKDPSSVATMWETWGQTNGANDNPLINGSNVRNSTGAPDEDFLASEAVRNNFMDKPSSPYIGARSMYLGSKRYKEPPAQAVPTPVAKPQIPGVPNIPQAPGNYPKPEVPTVTGDPQTGKTIDWAFTPWQKISQGYNLAKYAMANRYMPARSHINPRYMEPQLVNPEQTVGDMQNAANSQIRATNSLSPIMRNAQSANSFGQLLDRIPGVRSQYDNQNAQITNNARQYNTQIANSTGAINSQNDANYYKESVVGRQNFDNMKSYLGDQYMNNLLRDVETNQALSYNLATLDHPAYDYDWQSGNFVRNSKSIQDVAGDNKADLYTQLAQKLYDKVSRGETLSKPEVDFFKGLSIGKLPFTSAPRKKGGTINPYK